MSEHFDAVVVGSGFGGSINALRMAEAGKSVLVLERGRAYKPADFPRDVTDIGNLFWQQPNRSHRRGPDGRGLYEVRFFSGIAVVAASGLGGGSLIYANIHIRPDPVVFEDPRWPGSINRATLDPYFDKVAVALKIAPLPPEIRLPKRDIFRKAAAQLGREVFDPDMAVAWKESPGPGRQPCLLIADCEFGCPHGAKHTLDLTYLAEASRLGAQMRTGLFVTHVEPDKSGYRVHYQHVGNDAKGSVTGARVVLSAGTLGTNEILLRSRYETRTLSQLSTKLGFGFSGNGDFLGSIQNSATDLEPWHGPDVTSVIRYFDSAPEFTMAAPSFNRDVMTVLASHGQPSLGWLRFLSPLLWPRLERLLPRLFAKGVFSSPAKFRARRAGEPGRMTNLFAIGRDNANGRLYYKRGRLDVAWNYARENRELINRMTQAMNEVARVYGGTFATFFTWQVFHRILTVHPLGGCRLSDSPQDGVVSPEGEVHGYPGLFVADGSVIPTSLGFHPCMTISAIAERIAEAAVGSFSR